MIISNADNQRKQMTERESGRWRKTEAVMTKRRRSWRFSSTLSSLHTTTACLLPLLLLFFTVSSVRGNLVVSSHSQEDHTSPTVYEDEYGCEEFDEYQEANVLYMNELFARMMEMDKITSGSSVSRDSWERITATCQSDWPGFNHMLAFNISWLGQEANITKAKVLVITESGRSGCQPQLREPTGDRRLLPCENRPFNIRRLAAVDVTSLLSEQLGQSHLNVYIRRRGHFDTAVLVLLHNISPQQLFTGTRLMRCRNPLISSPDVCAHTRTRNKRAWNENRSKRSHMQRRRRNRRKMNQRKNRRSQPQLIKGPIGEQAVLDDVSGKKTERQQRTVSKAGHSGQRGVRRGRVSTPTIYTGMKGKSVRQQKEKEDDDVSTAQERSKKRWSRAADANLENTRSAMARKVDDSGQLPPFETPTQLYHHLNQRRKRSAVSSNNADLDTVTQAPDACQVRDFVLIPWDDLRMSGVISPTVLSIGQCVGQCPAIIQPNDNVPMYSYLISLMYVVYPANYTVPPPSCRPTMFESFSVMRFEGEDLIIERWPNARVIGCTCI